MNLGCVACGGQLGEKADMEAMLCGPCVEKRDAVNNKKKVFEWEGILTKEVNWPVENLIGKNVHVDFYTIGEMN